MVFTLRLLHIFTVNKQLGPKIVIVNKMVRGAGPGGGSRGGKGRGREAGNPCTEQSGGGASVAGGGARLRLVSRPPPPHR